MEMPSSDEKPEENGRKFRIPDWMAHNLERLNTATDIDQYAFLPLEADGFLPECSLNSQNSNFSLLDSGKENSHQSISASTNSTEKKIGEASCKQMFNYIAADVGKTKQSAKHQIINAIKNEEGNFVYSSPDTTPYVTPDSSPAPRRKISFSTKDTVQSNPQKWFYISNIKNKKKIANLDKCDEKNSSVSNEINKIEVNIPNQNSLKLTISNFDLNAISPSSW